MANVKMSKGKTSIRCHPTKVKAMQASGWKVDLSKPKKETAAAKKPDEKATG